LAWAFEKVGSPHPTFSKAHAAVSQAIHCAMCLPAAVYNHFLIAPVSLFCLILSFITINNMPANSNRQFLDFEKPIKT
jgi:hypothetical protein